jgi:hypothetical protein
LQAVNGRGGPAAARLVTPPNRYHIRSLERPITISLVTDDYVRETGGRWLCRRRAFKTLFQGGAPAHNPKL